MGGVCDMGMCLARGSVGGDGGRVDERIGFSASPILWGQGQCWTCVGCGGVGGEWVGGLDQGRERRCLCEYGLSV